MQQLMIIADGKDDLEDYYNGLILMTIYYHIGIYTRGIK